MTDNEPDEGLRALFDNADLVWDAAPRDLVTPAIAWGRARRRLDRLAVTGAVGALSAVAVFGAVALRPGAAVTVSPGTAASTPGPTSYQESDYAGLSEADTITQVEKTFNAMLPPGYAMNFDTNGSHAQGWQLAIDQMGAMTSPAGSSMFQILPQGGVGQPGPADAGFFKTHTANAANPVSSGTLTVPGGTVTVDSRDFEAGYVNQDDTEFTSPDRKHDVVGNEVDYTFTPSDTGLPARYLQLTELTTDVPVKSAAAQADFRNTDGYDPHGPVMTPQQFGAFAADPLYAKLDALLAHLRKVAVDPFKTGGPAATGVPTR